MTNLKPFHVLAAAGLVLFGSLLARCEDKPIDLGVPPPVIVHPCPEAAPPAPPPPPESLKSYRETPAEKELVKMIDALDPYEKRTDSQDRLWWARYHELTTLSATQREAGIYIE
jgi:hypothetical protein